MKTKLSFIVLPALLSVSATSAGQAPLQQELAQARRATAAYQSVARAEADGYMADFYESGEGFHYINFALIDCTFDADRPELLLYAVLPNGRLHLAGLEYVIPLSCSPTAPEGFTGDEDIWREDTEEFGLWEMTAWLWFNNPDGMFTALNPRIP